MSVTFQEIICAALRHYGVTDKNARVLAIEIDSTCVPFRHFKEDREIILDKIDVAIQPYKSWQR